MAEYIEKEKILTMTTSYKSELGRLKAEPFVKCGIETVEGFINELPTADVIERSKIDKAIEEIKELYTEWENTTDEARLESNPFGAVLNIIQRNIGE